MEKKFSASQDPPEISQIEYCINILNRVTSMVDLCCLLSALNFVQNQLKEFIQGRESWTEIILGGLASIVLDV
jgi:hypothetical protein